MLCWCWSVVKWSLVAACEPEQAACLIAARGTETVERVEDKTNPSTAQTQRSAFCHPFQVPSWCQQLFLMS